MKKPFFLLLLSFCTGFLSHVYGQTSPTKGSLADVSFIEGHWLATANGNNIEAVWSAPAGDNIVGFIRMMKDNKVTLYEMFAFEQTEQGPVVMVKHFKPGLVGVEEKEISDRYRFIEAGKDRAIFEKQGDVLRVLYEKRAKDQFVIALGKQQEGKWVFKDLFVFNRVQGK